jgi:hypothetical protein
MRNAGNIALAVLLIGSLLLAAESTRTPAALAQVAPFASPTALPNERPDACERNERPEQACVLALDSANGPFTFLPDGDQDYYSVDLGPEPGLPVEVTVRATSALDLYTTITRAGEPTPIATIATPAISTTLEAGLVGWLVLRVENRAPSSSFGETYTVEMRRVLPPPPTATEPAAEDTAPKPDTLEDNWNVAHASPIAVDVVYDLTFACPVPWGCIGGDHDYLAVPVKAGVRYRIATFDLGPGVDTVLDLFWGSEETPLLSNDDAFPGTSLLSALSWQAPSNGMLIVRVGPRTGPVQPIIPEKGGGTYRLMVALAASNLGQQLDERLREQSGITRTATPSPSSDGDGSGSATGTTAQPTVATDVPQGPAVVVAESTVLREAPAKNAPALETLPQESSVTLLGQSSGPWVRVQSEGGVLPGWVYAPDLRALSAAAPATTEAPTSGLSAGSPTPVVSGEAPTPTPAPALPHVQPLEPLSPPAAPVPPRATLSVAVQVLIVPAITPSRGQAGRATPAPETLKPLAGVRVQLVTVFGDVLAEALTSSSGSTTLTRDLPSTTAVLVRAPALGMQFPIDRAQPSLTITIPEGATQ